MQTPVHHHTKLVFSRTSRGHSASGARCVIVYLRAVPSLANLVHSGFDGPGGLA